MTETTKAMADVFIETIAGVRKGEYSLIPVCPQAHAFFKALGCMDENGNPYPDRVADVMKGIAMAITGEDK